MKQHILPDQLTELSPAARKRLRAWWKSANGDWFAFDFGDGAKAYLKAYDNPVPIDALPLFSVGQMIEFLDEHGHDFSVNYIGRGVATSSEEGDWGVRCETDYEYTAVIGTHEELCNACGVRKSAIRQLPGSSHGWSHPTRHVARRGQHPLCRARAPREIAA